MSHNMLLNILDNQKTGYMILDENLEVIYANKVVKNFSQNQYGMFGNYMNCRQTIKGNTCGTMEGCGTCSIRKNIMKLLIDKEQKWLVNVPFNKKDKTIFIDCLMEYYEGYITLQFFNLSEHNQELFFLEKLLDHTNDLIFYKDANLNYQYVNQAYANLLNREKENIINKSDEDILPTEILSHCIESDRLALEKGELDSLEELNGIVYKVSKTKINDGVIAIGKEVTDEYNKGQLAFIDELTTLPNRRQLMEEIAQIYKQHESNYYLALIDLDNLREINNTYGHHQGDYYLKSLAKVLLKCDNMKCFRLAGDEFVAIISGHDEFVTKTFINLYDQLQALPLKPKLSISTGIKPLDLNLSFSKNYELTDDLLYAAKRNGKNKFYLL